MLGFVIKNGNADVIYCMTHCILTVDGLQHLYGMVQVNVCLRIRYGSDHLPGDITVICPTPYHSVADRFRSRLIQDQITYPR